MGQGAASPNPGGRAYHATLSQARQLLGSAAGTPAGGPLPAEPAARPGRPRVNDEAVRNAMAA
eukprot:5046921-Amphidinium_carterae.1